MRNQSKGYGIIRPTPGFALPTVLIASVVLMVILTTSVQITVASSTSLEDNYYERAATLAAEAGIEHARACLDSNNNIAQWNSSSPLRPGSTCNGYAGGGCPSSCFIVNGDGLQTTYTVGTATSHAGDIISFNSLGEADRLRTSTGSVWRSYTSRVGHSVWLNQ
ncbi:hypothetical protein CL689_07255 [Candidatus Saccharibacteria bacterium]|nr:hypothetical protein [Candidatus Saccharibacteria bacterium]MBJ58213.1 hypothetical protein [Candidatus Saccharibacteria bacterium]MBQ69815.1 hypothetical protein [Candidatus Saccharibacteria bacterium]|tara:strand:- start:156 stop:647 length:492 start_codon:yes stop_codon:yes gene_type:complete